VDDGCLITVEQHHHVIARSTAGYDKARPTRQVVANLKFAAKLITSLPIWPFKANSESNWIAPRSPS
jgi:hypothetical protein